MSACDNDILQWLFDSDAFMSVFNWPIDVSKLCDSLSSIKSDSLEDKPSELVKHWNNLGGALGPTMLARFISSDSWRHIVPSVQGYGDDWCNVWVGDSKRVVARVVYSEQDETKVPVNVRFHVEDVE